MDDVKCLLQAAERQVDSLKKERDMESIESARRLAALESKVCDPQSTRNLKYLVRKTQGGLYILAFFFVTEVTSNRDNLCSAIEFNCYILIG